MDDNNRPKVLLIAPYFDRNVPGESWSTYKWVEGISRSCDTTVLTCHRPGWVADDSPTAVRRLVNWDEPKIPGFRGRLVSELKPSYPYFYFKARRWIKRTLREGEHFDLIHQISPLALRYPSPARGLGVPYIIGPLAGSLPTPPGFADAARERKWYRKLRGLDPWRLRHDPWLRSTYAGAAAVVGVAPYVGKLLASCHPQRFEVMAETGVEQLASTVKSGPVAGEPLRLLFVGRIIRTKGILDAIRAIARIESRFSVTLDVIGIGDLLETCREEVRSLGLTDRVTFHGRLPREEVFAWYHRADVFLFPSFREPSGNVVFEAMSQGLPVITSTVGGPGYVVDDSCGIRVEPVNPDRYPDGLAHAIMELANDPGRLARLSAGALHRMESLALWPGKIETMLTFYCGLPATKPAPAADETPALVTVP